MKDELDFKQEHEKKDVNLEITKISKHESNFDFEDDNVLRGDLEIKFYSLESKINNVFLEDVEKFIDESFNWSDKYTKSIMEIIKQESSNILVKLKELREEAKEDLSDAALNPINRELDWLESYVINATDRAEITFKARKWAKDGIKFFEDSNIKNLDLPENIKTRIFMMYYGVITKLLEDKSKISWQDFDSIIAHAVEIALKKDGD